MSILAALWNWFSYYYYLLQRHSRTDSRTIIVYCIDTLGLIPVILLSILAVLWNWFSYCDCLLQRHFGTDSRAITVYFIGTLGPIPALLLSIAAALLDRLSYYPFLLYQWSETGSLFSLLPPLPLQYVCCNYRSVTAHYCNRTCSTVGSPTALAAVCCPLITQFLGHSECSLCLIFFFSDSLNLLLISLNTLVFQCHSHQP